MRVRIAALGVLCAVALLPLGSICAQDTGIPDTVYFGDQGVAYGLPGGVFKIPVYVVSDQTLGAVQCGMEYGLAEPNVAFDSVSLVFADPITLSVFTLLPFGNHVGPNDGINPDTLGLAAVSWMNPALPPGRYRLGDVVFHGAAVGGQITVDSTFFPPAADFSFLEASGTEYTPQFVGGVLSIVESPGEFYLLSATEYAGDAGYPIAMFIEVISGFSVAEVALDSIVNAATGVPIASDSLPVVQGLNPAQIVWTPNTLQFGIWHAYFRVIDTQSNVLPVDIRLDVAQLPANCDIVRGDLNCDGVISIADAVYVINYIFGGGPAPGCK